MHNIVAFQIAENINIKEFRKSYTAIPLYIDSSEILYKNLNEQYFYVMSYGVVVFVDYDDTKMSELIEFISPYSKNLLKERLREEFSVTTNNSKDMFGYNAISLKHIDTQVLKIVMINVGQSVAIDYFTQQTELLLEKTKKHTLELEIKGKISTSGKRLRKFIGKSLNLKNRIAENLYILDSPDETWEDEYLGKIDAGLKRTFDIQIRYRNISDDLQIVKENLELFKDFIQHHHSSMLEWIIIILILVEVINMILEKLF